MATNKVFGSGYGIDFGTTNSVVALCDKSGRSRALTTNDGRPHPSVVWFQLDGTVRVGQEAKHNIHSFSEVPGNHFVPSIKRRLGQGKTLHVFGQPRSAADVASEIFKHLLSHARGDRGREVREGVVTIPINFDGRARRELRQAADKAGLFIKTFVHEPFAALVWYCYGDGSAHHLDKLEGRKILVFDWGGGTLDITLAAVDNGNLIELSTSGLSDRAGDHFDQRIMDHTSSRFLDRNRLSPLDCVLAPNVRDRYLMNCENAKLELSEGTQTQVQVAQAFRVEDQTYNVSEPLSRLDFESLVRPDVRDAMREVDKALEAADLSTSEIDLVLLIGGSSRIPAVTAEMQQRFGHRLVDVPNGDTIIAEGAAVVDALGLQPVFAGSVGIQLSDNSFYEVFPAGTIAKPGGVPSQVNLFCTDNRDGRARLIVRERRNGGEGGDNTLAVVPIPVSSALGPKVPERVTVSFSLDEDLVLQVVGKGATQVANASVELHNLCFALRTQEADHG